MARTKTRSAGRSGSFEVAIAALPLLIIRMGMAVLRVKAKRRKGVKVFRRQLRESGLANWQIVELVTQYEQSGRLRSYLPTDFKGLPFFFG